MRMVQSEVRVIVKYASCPDEEMMSRSTAFSRNPTCNEAVEFDQLALAKHGVHVVETIFLVDHLY